MDEVRVVLNRGSIILQPDTGRKRERVKAGSLRGTRLWLLPSSAPACLENAELEVTVGGVTLLSRLEVCRLLRVGRCASPLSTQ